MQGLKSSSKPEPVPTEGERNAAYFASRLENSENNLKKLSADNYDPTSTWNSFQRAIVPNALADKNTQLQAQAERDFVNAILRRESGAVISEQEFASAEKQYFPRLYDDPEVVKQKEQNRAGVIAAIKSSAGRAPVTSVGDPIVDTMTGNSSSTASRPVWQNPNRRVGVKP